MPGAADDRTWYVVMGVEPDAPAEEIRAAYLRLARTLHPDRHEGSSATEQNLAERRMREVNAAWKVLGDPAQRADYDRSLAHGVSSSSWSPGTATPRPPQTRPQMRPRPEATWRRPDALSGTRGPDGQPLAGMVDQDGGGSDDDDMVELSRHEVFFLRRVPVIIAIAIALAIFIGTAYLGSSSSNRTRDSLHIPTTIPCHIVEPGSC